MGKAILSSCLVLLVYVSCESNFVGHHRDIPFETIDEDASFAVPEPGTGVIRDEEEWLALWEKYWAVYDGKGNKTPPPRVDFDRDMVIALFYGGGYSGCSNGVEVIESITKTPGRIKVRVGPVTYDDLGPCEAIVYPLQMVTVRKSSRRVVFVGDVPE